MVILPIPLSGCGSIGFSGIGASIDRLLGIDGRTVRMARHMGGCYCLTGSTGSRTRSRIRSYVTRGSMRIKGCLANDCHLENACLEPCLERFNRLSWATVFWEVLLEVGQDTLGAVNGPDSLCLLIRSLYQ